MFAYFVQPVHPCHPVDIRLCRLCIAGDGPLINDADLLSLVITSTSLRGK